MMARTLIVAGHRETRPVTPVPGYAPLTEYIYGVSSNSVRIEPDREYLKI
jgi:hypothetical protein